MTPYRAASSLVCLLGFVVLSGCKTVTMGETYKYGFSEVHANAPAGAAKLAPTDFQLSAKSWKHEWRCNVLDTCNTDFFSTMFVFDKRTGKQLKWNRVEVYLKEGCDASTEDRLHYKTIADTEFVSFGWGDDRQGKYDHVSAFLVFYADWGSINARVRTNACP